VKYKPGGQDVELTMELWRAEELTLGYIQAWSHLAKYPEEYERKPPEDVNYDGLVAFLQRNSSEWKSKLTHYLVLIHPDEL